jgi:hypothetical protein
MPSQRKIMIRYNRIMIENRKRPLPWRPLSCQPDAPRTVERLRSARIVPPVHAAGRRRGVGDEPFDQIDNFRPLQRRKLDECLQQPQAFDRFARRISELLAQFGKISAIFHLAPLTGKFRWVRQVESMPRNNSAGKANCQARKWFRHAILHSPRQMAEIGARRCLCAA